MKDIRTGSFTEEERRGWRAAEERWGEESAKMRRFSFGDWRPCIEGGWLFGRIFGAVVVFIKQTELFVGSRGEGGDKGAPINPIYWAFGGG